MVAGPGAVVDVAGDGAAPCEVWPQPANATTPNAAAAKTPQDDLRRLVFVPVLATQVRQDPLPVFDGVSEGNNSIKSGGLKDAEERGARAYDDHAAAKTLIRLIPFGSDLHREPSGERSASRRHARDPSGIAPRLQVLAGPVSAEHDQPVSRFDGHVAAGEDNTVPAADGGDDDAGGEGRVA